MKKNLFTIILLIILCYHFCFPQSEVNSKYPVRIILNLTSTPSKSMAVTWRTNAIVRESKVQVAAATDWIDFAKLPRSIIAKTEKVYTYDSIIVYHHYVIMNSLLPNTLYAYRVGGDSVWSEWNQFTTSNKNAAPFEFIFMGDPQVGFKDYLPRIFRTALTKNPDTKFWLMTGDLVDNPKKDALWNDLFKSLEFIPRIIPSIMVPGNHEYMPLKSSGEKVKNLTRLWRPHFTLPENGIDSLEETSYYFDYQGVRFIMLNGQERLPQQAAWLEKLLSDNQNRWTIVAVHQPFFSMGAERDERDVRNAFMKLIDKYSVDLVLTGHDHVYSRSYKLNNGSIVKDSEKGTVYVVSVSGTKAYKLTYKYKDLMVKYGENIQLYHVISIDNNKLSFKAFTARNTLYDSFELIK